MVLSMARVQTDPAMAVEYYGHCDFPNN
jgi:hypothetical protein